MEFPFSITFQSVQNTTRSPSHAQSSERQTKINWVMKLESLIIKQNILIPHWFYSFFLCFDFSTFWETLFRRFGRHFFAPEARKIGCFGSAAGAPETDFWAPQAPRSQKETDLGAAGTPEIKETILRALSALLEAKSNRFGRQALRKQKETNF